MPRWPLILVAAAIVGACGGASPGKGEGMACSMTSLPDRDRIVDLLGYVPASPSPLTAAVLCDDIAAAETALRGGADPNAREAEGATAVTVAAAIPRPAILTLLLRHGGDADAVDTSSHFLALTYALQAGQTRGDWGAWDALLGAGADVNKRPDKGSTAAEMAVSMGAMDRIVALIERGYRNDPARLVRYIEQTRVNERTEPARQAALARARALAAGTSH